MRKFVLLSMLVLVLALLSTQTAAARHQPAVIPFEGYVITCGLVDPGQQWIDEDGLLHVRNAQFYGETYMWKQGGTLAEDMLPMLSTNTQVTLHIDALGNNQARVFSTYTLDPTAADIAGIWRGIARGTFIDFPATRDGEFYYGANGSRDLAAHHMAAVSNSMPIDDLPIPVCDGMTPRSARYMEGIITYPPGR